MQNHVQRHRGKKSNVLGVAGTEKKLSLIESVLVWVYTGKQNLRQGFCIQMMRSDPREQEWGMEKPKQGNEISQYKSVFLSSALPWMTMTQFSWDSLRNPVGRMHLRIVHLKDPRE